MVEIVEKIFGIKTIKKDGPKKPSLLFQELTKEVFGLDGKIHFAVDKTYYLLLSIVQQSENNNCMS